MEFLQEQLTAFSNQFFLLEPPSQMFIRVLNMPLLYGSETHSLLQLKCLELQNVVNFLSLVKYLREQDPNNSSERKSAEFSTLLVKTVSDGLESLEYLRLNTWEVVLVGLKQSRSYSCLVEVARIRCIVFDMCYAYIL